MAFRGVPPTGDQDEVLKVQEVAEYLKVTSKTVYALVKEGALPAFRVGRVLRCRRVDVEEFIAAQVAGGGNGVDVEFDSEARRAGGTA